MAATSKRENQKWTATDGACNNCRVRKIRCGREKPQCSSCYRDQVECVYSSPPKRINHVKVLCENFDDIHNRLILVQQELSTLTSLFKKSNAAENLSTTLSSDSRLEGTAVENGGIRSSMGHVVRNLTTHVESYHGPWTILAQCREFSSLLSSQANDHAMFGELLGKLCHHAEADAIQEGEPTLGDDQIYLPPRHFASVMLSAFFRQTDYTSDIFIPKIVHEEVDKLYQNPNQPGSRPWAVCLNLIILVVLGTEHPINSDDPFVRPIFQTAHTPLRLPEFFMSSRLVSVQVFALLSLFAQQYHPESIGDFIFAQACTTARTMGLHSEPGLARAGRSSDEALERQKVFRSLYIRDRSSAMSRGTIPWFQIGDCQDSMMIYRGPDMGSQRALLDQFPSPRWDLAQLQDELLQLLLPSSVSKQCTFEDSKNSLVLLRRKLEAWSQTHKIPSVARPTSLEDVSLHLAFLSTRIRVLSHLLTGETANFAWIQVLHDSRVCCLLVISFCTYAPDERFTSRLDRLLGTPGSTPVKEDGTVISSTTWTSSNSPAEPSLIGLGESTLPKHHPSPGAARAPGTSSILVHRLAPQFPAGALFTIARSILSVNESSDSNLVPQTETISMRERQQEASEDVLLLKAVLACVINAPTVAKNGVSNYTSKLAHVAKDLVGIIAASGSGPSLGKQAGAQSFDSASPVIFAPPPSLLEDNHTQVVDSSDTVAHSNFASISDIEVPDLWSSSQSTWVPHSSAHRSSVTSSGTSTMIEQSLDFTHLSNQWGLSDPIHDGQNRPKGVPHESPVTVDPAPKRQRRQSWGFLSEAPVGNFIN